MTTFWPKHVAWRRDEGPADRRRTARVLKEVAYYENIRKGLGRRFRTAATGAFEKAGELPLSGKPGVAETRRNLVKGFPFAVIYIPFEHEVVIYTVSHLSRKPAYWLGRLQSDG